jgi:hypothetical protein
MVGTGPGVRVGEEIRDTSSGMTPILVPKVRSLQATQEASVPCQADLRGASTVGKGAVRDVDRLSRL